MPDVSGKDGFTRRGSRLRFVALAAAGSWRAIAGCFADVLLIPWRQIFLDPVVSCQAHDGMIRVAQIDLRRLGKSGLQLAPPGLVKGGHCRDAIGLLRVEISLLPGVARDVVEFFPVHETPFARHNGSLLPLDRIPHPLRVGHDKSSLGHTGLLRRRIEERADRDAVEIH